MKLTGARILMECLREQKVDTIFGYPGGTILNVYDEFELHGYKDKIRHIFDTIMTDDEKGKELRADGEYVDRKINTTPIDSQEQFFEEAYKNADKSADNQ